MEQLAERRMQREEEAQYPPYELHSSVPSHHGHGGAGHGSPEEDEYDDEEDEQYDSEEDDYDDEDEMVCTLFHVVTEGRS